jgi:hypothetical protein
MQYHVNELDKTKDWVHNWATVFQLKMNTATLLSRLEASQIWDNKYGHESLQNCWRGPEVTVKYRPVLKSKRAAHINKPAAAWGQYNSGYGPQMGVWHQDRLVDWPSVVT